MNKLIQKFKALPYWVKHGIVSVSIQLGFAFLINIHFGTGLAIGFYAGREYVQWESMGKWDLPGLFGGTLPPAVIYIFNVLVTIA